MGAVSRTRTATYTVGILLSAITLGVSAAATSLQFTFTYYKYAYSYAPTYVTASPPMFRGTLALSILCFLYFSISLGIWLFNRSSILVSVMVDFAILCVLFLIGVGTSAWPSATYGWAVPIGAASVAFGWVLTLYLLALMIFFAVYTSKRRGGTNAWKSTLHDLEAGNYNKGTTDSHTAAQPGMTQPTSVQHETVYQQQPVYATQPAAPQSVQQGGFVVQPSFTDATTTPAPITSNNTGGSYLPQSVTSLPQPQQSYTPVPQHSYSPIPQQSHSPIPQQSYTPAPQHQYTVKLAQHDPGQSQTVYNYSIAQPGSSSLPLGVHAPPPGKG